MSLIEHLEELRSRIIVVAIAIVAGRDRRLLPVRADHRDPARGASRREADLLQISVGESLAVRLRVALYVGIALAMPVILFQLWRFVTPGLTRGERRLIWPMLIVATLLFALGIGIGYFIDPVRAQLPARPRRCPASRPSCG